MEFATLDWVYWYNEKRLLEPIGDILQRSLSNCIIRISRPASMRPDATKTVSGKPGAVHFQSWGRWSAFLHPSYLDLNSPIY